MFRPLLNDGARFRFVQPEHRGVFAMNETPKVIEAPALVVAPGPAPTPVPAPQPGMPEDKLPSTTTPEQDRTTQGQRDTSMMWERNQGWITKVVISGSVIVAGMLSIFGHLLGAAPLQLPAAMFLFQSSGVVMGFYFGRTNHTKVGGTGDTHGKER